MVRHTAVIATTHLLANGFRHTREDLESLAEGFRAKINIDPFLNENHLEGIAPIARVHSAYVDHLRSADTVSRSEHALYITFEVLPGADPSTVRRFIEQGGFSVAFFGHGLGRGPAHGADLRLTVGISAELIPNIQEAELALDALEQDVPGTVIEVRRFHEHALVSAATVVFVVGWVAGKVADKLFERLWSAVESAGLQKWRDLVDRIKLSFDTRNGTVHVSMPARGDAEAYRRTLHTVVDEVLALEAGMLRRRISMQVTEEWTLTKHEEALPPLSEVPGGD